MCLQAAVVFDKDTAPTAMEEAAAKVARKAERKRAKTAPPAVVPKKNVRKHR